VTISITLNGDAAEVDENLTVASLLDRLKVEPRRVVVEHNRRILRGEELAGSRIAAGDELELIQLVGGG